MPKQTTHAKSKLGTTTLLDPLFLRQAMALLAIPSVFTHPEMCNKALQFIVNILWAHPQITVERFEQKGVRSILAYVGPTRPARFKVLLNGHVDVVPALDAQFHPRIEGNRLYARGALDMKVAALILTNAFCELAPKVSYPLGLQIVTDEEPGGYDGAYYQFMQGVRTDFYLTAEQSWNDVAIAAKGVSRLIITREGIAAHSGYLWRGENAVLKLMALVQKLHSVYPVPSEEAWVTTANVAKLTTNENAYFNRVPDQAELHLDIRPVIDDPNFKNEATIRDFFAALDPFARITSFTFEKGHETPESDPILQQLLKAATDAKGAPVNLLRRHAQSDLRHYNPDPKCRGVEFGLKGKNDHGDDEYLDLASVPIMQRALTNFLRDLRTT